MKITLHDEYKGDYTLDASPYGYKWGREIGCADVVLRKSVSSDIPIAVYISIRSDGSIRLMKVDFEKLPNYYHTYSAPEKITPEQEKTIAAIWAEKVSELNIEVDDGCPTQILSGLGATPQSLLSDSVSNILDRYWAEKVAVA